MSAGSTTELDPLLHGEVSRGLLGLREHGSDSQVLHLERQLARLDPYDVEQIADQAIHLVDGVRPGRDEFFAFRLV